MQVSTSIGTVVGRNRGCTMYFEMHYLRSGSCFTSMLSQVSEYFAYAFANIPAEPPSHHLWLWIVCETNWDSGSLARSP